MLHNASKIYLNPAQTVKSDTSVSSPHIPRIGLGTFQPTPDGVAEVKAAVLEALKAGYRHIDTAWAYDNGQVEKKVGEAIAQWIENGGPREDLFIVTKLHNTFHDPDDVQVGLAWSLQNLGLDYIDLFLMHNSYAYAKYSDYTTVRKPDGSGKPVIDYELSRQYPSTWSAMSDLKHAGKTRMIGVSNFNILKLGRIISETGITPDANQVEFNPYFPQYDLLSYCTKLGITLIAHCPLGRSLAPSVSARGSNAGPLAGEKIHAIAHSRALTAAQLILAWLFGLGYVAVPKSNNAERIRANFRATEVQLSQDEFKVLSELMGPNGERGVRKMVSKGHIGFDVYDEAADQPV